MKPPVRTTVLGKPKPAPARMRICLEQIEMELVREAARLYQLPPHTWARRVLAAEAFRVRVAASNVPQGLHPHAKVYRVRHAPVQGAWDYGELFVAKGHERLYVTSFANDAPEGVSKDRQACWVDVIGVGKNLMVALKNVRWIGNAPLASSEVVERNPVAPDSAQE